MNIRIKDGEYKKWQWIGSLLLVVVFSGIFGWVYEFIFYYFNGGMKEFYMQGGNYLPWINIYAIGAILILICTYKVRRYPWAVFLISAVVTGVLEYAAGWLIYNLGNGTRYWDYNTEILNFGNIDGFICLRSVLFFGVSGMILMYLMLPFCLFLSKKLPRKVFLGIAIALFTLFIADEAYNIIAKAAPLPGAPEFYRSLGWHYVGDI